MQIKDVIQVRGEVQLQVFTYLSQSCLGHPEGKNKVRGQYGLGVSIETVYTQRQCIHSERMHLATNF